MNIPDFVIPPLFGRVSEKLPSWPADQMVLLALNMSIRLGILPKDSLETIEGRVIGFEVLDLSFETAITYLNGKFWHAEVDSAELMMRANAAHLLQLLNRQEDPDTLFFNRDLIIEGDTELGLSAKNLLDSVDWTTLSLSPLSGFFNKKAKA